MLCDKKEDDGLGFRDLEAFNDAMLGKQFWRLINNQSSLPFRILKAKYFPSTEISQDELGNKPSYIWRSIWGARWVVKLGLRVVVGDGLSTRVWDDPWIPRGASFKVVTTCREGDWGFFWLIL